MLSLWFSLMCVVGDVGNYEVIFSDRRDTGVFFINCMPHCPQERLVFREYWLQRNVKLE
jgi:hypothetical protein